MASRTRIAIDCMGGDFGLRASVPAAVKALALYPDLQITLVGDQPLIQQSFNNHNIPTELSRRLKICHADDVVHMSDKPSTALRHKKHSSMRIAIDLLKTADVEAVVSGGNTGALMAIGHYVLKTLPGIERPAICSAIPSTNGFSLLLDLGANVDCSSAQLHQFASMGSALYSAISHDEAPRVAVLNIGQEEIKGNDLVKDAIELISIDKQLNFIGSIEADQLMVGKADVIVCDGFVGNVALKACEGTAAFISSAIASEFRSSWQAKLRAYFAKPSLDKLSQQLDPQQYNGASFLGLQGIIVKSHGNSREEGFLHAISQARKEINGDLINLIKHRLTTRR